MTESTFGGDTEFEEEETSASSDVREGYDSDSRNSPPERVVYETSEDDVNSAEADRVAGYDDKDIEDDATLQ
jgi:hypothetical protein